MTTALTNTDELFGQIEYIAASEVGTFFQECPPELYFRGSTATIPAETINAKKEELTYRNSNEAVAPVVRVLSPFLCWEVRDDQGNVTRYLINGNTRRRALVEMQAQNEYAGSDYAPIPYQVLQTEATSELLYRLQVDSNDTTVQHTVTEKALKAKELYDKFYAQAELEGKNKTQAGSYAKQATGDFLGVNPTRVTQLTSVLETPQWFQDQISAGTMAFEVALLMKRFSEQSGFPLITVFNGCNSLKDEKSTKITEKTLNAYKKMLKADVDAANNKTGEGESAEKSPDVFEGGSSEAGEKPGKEFNRDQAIAALETVRNSVFNLEADDIVDEQLETLTNASSQIIKMIAAVVGSKESPVSEAKAIYFDLRDLFMTVFSDDEFIGKLEDGTLSQVQRAANAASKPLAVILDSSQVEGLQNDDEVKDDGYNDTEDDEDEELTGPITIENDEYVATVN